MYDELKMMLRETVVAYTWFYADGLRKTAKNLRITGDTADIRRKNLQNISLEHYL
jgi:hypothetical protein